MSPELLCDLCGQEYEVWSAPNSLWNATVRRDDGSDRWPFLCFGCFVGLAEQEKVRQVQARLDAAEAERNAAVAALVGMETRAQRAEARLGRAEQLLLTGTQPQIEAYFKERETVLAEQEKEQG